MVAWARVLSEPVIYQGHTQLRLNPTDALVARIAPETGSMPRRGRDELKRFMQAQSQILQSDTVLKKMVDGLVMAGLNLRSSSQAESESIGRKVDSSISAARMAMKRLLQIDAPIDQSETAEREIYREINGFKRRSLIEFEPTGDMVKLTVFHTSRDRIEEELRSWTNAYTVRVTDMASESTSDYLRKRTERYEALVNTRARELRAFKDKPENRAVSDFRLEYLTEQIARVQIERDDLRRRSEFGDLVDLLRTPSRARPTQESQEVSRVIRQLEVELEVMRHQKMTKSVKYGKLKERFEALRGIEEGIEEFSSLASSDERTTRMKKKLDALTAELEKLIAEKAQVKMTLDELHLLESRHQFVLDQERKFEQLKQESEDLLESQNVIQIQVAELPSVDTSPFEYKPVKKIAMGGVVGLGIGLLLACLLDVLHGKVRSKHDITDDFGLPVIGVFPK